jgi:hypothetical protein
LREDKDAEIRVLLSQLEEAKEREAHAINKLEQYRQKTKDSQAQIKNALQNVSDK